MAQQQTRVSDSAPSVTEKTRVGLREPPLPSSGAACQLHEIKQFPISYVGKITPEIYTKLYNQLDFLEKQIKIKAAMQELKTH
jgi:hypothetical protein